MAPFLVFDAQERRASSMALGSPGGSLIIDYVAKALVATLDWKLDVQSAIDLPNFGSRNGPTEIEKGTELEGVAGRSEGDGPRRARHRHDQRPAGIRRTRDGLGRRRRSAARRRGARPLSS